MRADVSGRVERVRAAFPALDDMTYLNTGTYGLTPQPVLARYLGMIERTAHYGFLLHDEAIAAVRQARRSVADLLDVPQSWVAFNRNATDGINGIFASLPWQPDDEVIISDQEHTALLFPWLYGQRRGLFRGKMFAVDADPDVTLRRLEAHVTPHTRLIACSHVSSQTGIRLPAPAICAFAREHNAQGNRRRPLLTLIDGAQAVGQWRLSVASLGCDFYVTNGHKWLGAPKGSGMLIVRESSLEHLTPPYAAGGVEASGDALGDFYERRDAQRLFEFGTQNLAVIAALPPGINWLQDLGWTWIEARECALTTTLRHMLRGLPHVHLLTPDDWDRSSALTTFTIEGMAARTVYEELWRQRIVTRLVPERDALRISTSYFNTDDDLDRLIGALESIHTPVHR